MIYDIEADGHTCRVDVGPEEGAWRVTVGGRAWQASMICTGDRWSLLLSEPGEGPDRGARSYDVAFEPSAAGGSRVHVDGAVVTASLRPPAYRLGRHREAAGASAGRIVAPMAGRVVKVLVAPGMAVEARQGVVVVEAMKMENELRAPRAGIVREVRVVEGASVDAHAVLVVIE